MISIVRTLLIILFVGGLVLLVFWRLGIDQHQRTIEELNALNEALEQQVQQREEMITRLSRNRRIAHLEITDQRFDDDGQPVETDILFIEVNDDGRELGRQQFTIKGHVLFVDAWTVKFDHHQVAHGHPLYGKTIVLLRRIYSELTAPADGKSIDTPGAIPSGYAGSEQTVFEQKIWKHFWELATDARRARDFGVRVAQGEAVYKPVKADQRYELIVDASGGMSLVPLAPEESRHSRAHD